MESVDASTPPDLSTIPEPKEAYDNKKLRIEGKLQVALNKARAMLTDFGTADYENLESITYPAEGMAMYVQDYCMELGVKERLLKQRRKLLMQVSKGTELLIQVSSGTECDLGNHSAGDCIIVVKKPNRKSRPDVHKDPEDEHIRVWQLANDSRFTVYAGYAPREAQNVLLTKIEPGTSEEQYLDLMRENWIQNSPTPAEQ